MQTAFDVANFFLALQDDDSGDTISNLKVQKLVYYAQGFHLAVFGKPLFDDVIEAWTHGPVVPDLYHAFKKFGQASIPAPKEFDAKIFKDDVRELLDDVYQVFGQFSAWKLRNMTHNEPPWANAVKSGDRVISHAAMSEYFRTQLTA